MLESKQDESVFDQSTDTDTDAGMVWNNCADEMPPAAMRVITDAEGYYNITTGKDLHDTASFREIEQKSMSHLQWTEYTQEKWEKLNPHLQFEE